MTGTYDEVMARIRANRPPQPGGVWRGIILGEPASKANSRKMAWLKSKGGGSRMASIKSDKALGYVGDVAAQVIRRSPLLAGPLRFTATLYYASERPDLDESALLDALQGRIYSNDRQIRERHVYHAIDRANPRAEVVIEEMGP